jgi:hypothetical protein
MESVEAQERARGAADVTDVEWGSGVPLQHAAAHKPSSITVPPDVQHVLGRRGLAFESTTNRSRFNMDVTDLRSSRDGTDADDKQRGCCGRARPQRCCTGDTFPARLWRRLKLDHLVADNAPGFLLLKSWLVVMVALLLDKATRNPDSVSTVFVGLLGLASYMHQGVSLAKQTLFAGLLGAVIGTCVAAACYVPPTLDPGKWMLLVSVPWSVAMTQYLIYFLGINQPAGFAAGMFSALFVVLVPFAYPPVDPLVPLDNPRRLIWQTLLVRVIALGTGVLSAYVVNMVVSAAAPLAIFRMTMFFSERLVWTTNSHRLDPVDARVQKNYSQIVNQVSMGKVVEEAVQSWVFSQQSRDEISLIRKRAKTIFRFLSFRSFLELYLESLDVRAQERDDVTRLIEFSMRSMTGGPRTGATLEEELAELEAFPDSLHVEKSVLKSVLCDLRSTTVWYRSEEDMMPFWGRV